MAAAEVLGDALHLLRYVSSVGRRKFRAAALERERRGQSGPRLSRFSKNRLFAPCPTRFSKPVCGVKIPACKDSARHRSPFIPADMRISSGGHTLRAQRGIRGCEMEPGGLQPLRRSGSATRPARCRREGKGGTPPLCPIRIRRQCRLCDVSGGIRISADPSPVSLPVSSS